MKLTTEQLDLIDRFLEQQKLDFLDFKLEVKDHLACETEVLMKEETLTFEEAFGLVSKKWSIDLQVKKSWIISNERAFPAMVIVKIKTKVMLHYGTVLSVAFVLMFVFSQYDFKQFDLFKYAVGLCGATYFLLMRIVNQQKIKTSYRFHFEYFYLSILMVFAYLFVVKISFAYADFLGFIVLIDFPFAVYNFYKHQQFIKKYDLI
uniref:hypothetical protein n=1 Tax=Flavobacterium sp. TaxID=239 RepID=UPI00404B0CE7